MRNTPLFTALMLTTLVGCASRSAPREKEAPRPLPAPAELSLRLTAILDLPEAAAAEVGLPAKVHVTLQIDGRAEAVDAKRSRYTATMKARATNPDGERAFADVDTTLTGEVAETPAVAIGQVFQQLTATAALLPSPPQRPVPLSADVRADVRLPQGTMQFDAKVNNAPPPVIVDPAPPAE